MLHLYSLNSEQCTDDKKYFLAVQITAINSVSLELYSVM
jgi:hypothetical protein